MTRHPASPRLRRASCGLPKRVANCDEPSRRRDWLTVLILTLTAACLGLWVGIALAVYEIVP